MKQTAEEIKVELIGKDIGYIQKDIAEIKASVKELAGVYVTKVQFEDSVRLLGTRLLEVEKSNNMWKWLSPTFSAILSGVIVFLLINYLQNGK